MIKDSRLDIFRLKIIAFAGTVLLNFAWSGFIPVSLTWLRMILSFFGASSIPILCLVISESIKHTRSIFKYMLRLIILAVLCGFPYYILYHDLLSGQSYFREYLSGPFTVFYIVGILIVYDKLPYKWLKNGSIFLFVIISVFFGIEYAPVSVIIAYIVHIYCKEDQRKFRNFNIFLFCVAIGIVGGVLYFYANRNSQFLTVDLLQLITLSGSILAIPLINRYNGHDNPFLSNKARFAAKYAFYLGYLVLISGLAVLKYFLVMPHA